MTVKMQYAVYKPRPAMVYIWKNYETGRDFLKNFAAAFVHHRLIVWKIH